jgi:hypothetical protein
MMHHRNLWANGLSLALGVAAAGSAGAWGYQGHQLVGAIADSLLVGTKAEKHVKKILGTETLQTAALWADCVKGVSNSAPFIYRLTTKYPECDPFQRSDAGRHEMEDYVRRNASACQAEPAVEPCHKQYHYTDVAIEHKSYDRADVGTSDHDVVSAIDAALAKLRGRSVPAPFSFETSKEALRALAHFVGDVHQPLHVGAIYLDALGHEMDPDAGSYDPATKTRGGNLLIHGPHRNLHSEWDSIPSRLSASRFLADGVAQARLVPPTSGPVSGWAAAWAGESVVASQSALATLSYGAEDNVGTPRASWPVTEPSDYVKHRQAVQEQQLVRAGARLAQLLEAVWP